VPVSDLFDELMQSSVNKGEVDISTFVVAGRQPAIDRCNRHDGTFALFRIGDATAGRGIHAAVYDAVRLCSSM
jgi:hypothetical protein